MAEERAITRWGENATGENMTDPELAQELSGYANQQKVPNGELNWLLRQLSSRVPPIFADPRDAVAQLPVGRVGILAPPVLIGDPPDEVSGHPFSKELQLDLGAVPGNAVACDGDLVFVGNNDGDMFCFTPDGTLLWSNTALPGAGIFKARSICADGEFVFCFRGVGHLIKLDRLTGAVVEDLDHSANAVLEAIDSNGDHLFVVGLRADGVAASPNTIAKRSRTTLAVHTVLGVPAVAEVDGAALTHDVCCHEGLVWVAHDRGTADAVVTVFDSTLDPGPDGNRWANANADARAIEVTRHGVFVGLTSDVTNGYNLVALPLRHSGLTGVAPIWTAAFATGSELPLVYQLAWDGDDLIIVAQAWDATYEAVRAYNVHSGACVAHLELSGENSLDARGVACDGWRVYVVGEIDSGNNGAFVYPIRDTPRLVRRVEAGPNRPFPRLLVW